MAPTAIPAQVPGAKLAVIGFCFGGLLEGIAGFGTPVAITSSLLILLGFPALEALVFTLIFNTAPVAFGALGTPVTVLGAVTAEGMSQLDVEVRPGHVETEFGKDLPSFAAETILAGDDLAARLNQHGVAKIAADNLRAALACFHFQQNIGGAAAEIEDPGIRLRQNGSDALHGAGDGGDAVAAGHRGNSP